MEKRNPASGVPAALSFKRSVRSPLTNATTGAFGLWHIDVQEGHDDFSQTIKIARESCCPSGNWPASITACHLRHVSIFIGGSGKVVFSLGAAPSTRTDAITSPASIEEEY
jgi:hypothetical protein